VRKYAACVFDFVLIANRAEIALWVQFTARRLAAARKTGAQAIHPGYGFLAENADLASDVVGAGPTWIGPSAESTERMGDKISARNLMERAEVPVSPCTRKPVADVTAALAAAGSLATRS
jgi:acetyl-CoA carboxylase, biotin carboxylase subunit